MFFFVNVTLSAVCQSKFIDPFIGKSPSEIAKISTGGNGIISRYSDSVIIVLPHDKCIEEVRYYFMYNKCFAYTQYYTEEEACHTILRFMIYENTKYIGKTKEIRIYYSKSLNMYLGVDYPETCLMFFKDRALLPDNLIIE